MKDSPTIRVQIPSIHEALSHLSADASALEIFEALARWFDCRFVFRSSEAAFYCVPNGDAPSQELLKAGFEAAQQFADGHTR